MAKFNSYDFVITNRDMVARGGSYSFRNYTDVNGVFGNIGAEILYDDGSKDRMGRSTGKMFTLGQSHYKLQSRDGQKDNAGLPLTDFFMNAPMCEGSPNGIYFDSEGYQLSGEETRDRRQNLIRLKSGEITQAGVEFRLLEDEVDAAFALDIGLKRAEAQLSTGKIDDQTLSEIAALIGEFGKPDQKLRHKVYEFAGHKPLDYFRYLETGDRAIRALIRKGIADGTLNKKGTIIYWEETILGNNEDAAVALLLGEDKMLEALQAKVDLRLQVRRKPEKPTPKFTKKTAV